MKPPAPGRAITNYLHPAVSLHNPDIVRTALVIRQDMYCTFRCSNNKVFHIRGQCDALTPVFQQLLFGRRLLAAGSVGPFRFLPPRFEPRTPQPVACFCTDDAVPPSDHDVDYVVCQPPVTLRVNRTVIFSFSTVGCLLMYLALLTT